MGSTSITWRGLTIDNDHGYKIESIEGWESLPAARYDKTSRANGHGSHLSPVYADERTVTVTGSCYSATDRDSLLLALQDSMGFSDTTDPFTVTHAGRTLSSGAQLTRCDPVIAAGGTWNVGLLKWVAQWRCPDPLRYGSLRGTLQTKAPTSGTGLAFPLFASGTLDFGTLGETGQVTLTNAGNMAATPIFRARGLLSQGFEISAAGKRLRYSALVPSGQLVLIDTADGTVVVENTADRRSNLTIADWITVPPRGSLLVQFTSLSGTFDSNTIFHAQIRDTYW